MKFSIRIFRNSANHQIHILHFFRISTISSRNLSNEMEISEKSSSQKLNHKLRSQETPNKPLDDACNICESSNTCTISEFLMIILRKFCDGTTFHHLWDHKILLKRDEWILQVSEVWFGNRSRIGNKLNIYAGRRNDFWDKKSSDFSGEIFRERNFGSSITAPTTLFPLIGCGVDSFSPN